MHQVCWRNFLTQPASLQLHISTHTRHFSLKSARWLVQEPFDLSQSKITQSNEQGFAINFDRQI